MTYWINRRKGESMTEEHKARVKHIVRRLRMTRRGETICLVDWEVGYLLEYIDDLRRGLKNAQVSAADRTEQNESVGGR